LQGRPARLRKKKRGKDTSAPPREAMPTANTIVSASVR
jgi:hypothetical protein